jgi:hypothetical protein
MVMVVVVVVVVVVMEQECKRDLGENGKEKEKDTEE